MSKKIKKNDPSSGAEKDAKKLHGLAGTLDFSDMEDMAIPMHSPLGRDKEIAQKAHKRKSAPKANQPVKATKKAITLNDNVQKTAELAKAKIADLRSRNASDQGVGNAASAVPNVDQDRLTGMKTAKPLSSAPKANVAVKPAAAPVASAPKAPGAAPAAPAAPGSKSPANAAAPKKSPYGKVIIKGELFLEKARVDEGKDPDVKAEARADRNVRTSANAMSAAGKPLRSVQSRMGRHEAIKEGSPGRKGEKIAGTPKEQDEASAGVHIRQATFAPGERGKMNTGAMSSPGGGKSYRSGGKFHSAGKLGIKATHEDIMNAQKEIKPKLGKGELFEKSSQPSEVKDARNAAAIKEKKARGIPDYKTNPDGKSFSMNRPNAGHAFGIAQQDKVGPQGQSSSGKKVRDGGQYMSSPKEDSQWRHEQLKNAPKPNLPKSENVQKADDAKLKQKLIAEQAAKTLSKRKAKK